MTYPGGRRALDAVSCAVRPGRITVLVGPNGAGKSTLLRVLAGVRRPDGGRVTIGPGTDNGGDSADLGRLNARARARRVALVSQQPAVAFDFDARRVVSFGAHGSGAGRDATERAVERFGLGDVAALPFGALSVGQRQRVSLARAWAQLGGRRGSYLLGDEPVSAMDPRFARHAMDAFRELADAGAGVCLVLHDLSSAARVADDAVLLDASGRVVGAGAGDGVLTTERLSALYATPVVRVTAPGVGPVVAPGIEPAAGSVAGPAPVS